MGKRFTLLALGAMLAGGLVAAPVTSVKESVKGYNRAIQPKFDAHVANHAKHVNQAPADDLGIITEPTGTPFYYTVSSESLLYGNISEVENYPCAVFYGEDDEVLLYKILPDTGWNTFIKGKLNDGVITVELPQVLQYSELWGYGFQLTLLKPEGKTYVPCEGNVEFMIFEDGDISLDLPGDDNYLLGFVFTDDYSFADLGYYSIVCSPTNLEGKVWPENLITETYYTNNGVYGYPVEVGFEGDEMYINGLMESMPSWTFITAKVDGNTAVINQNDPVGIYYDMFAVTKCVEDNDGEIELASPDAVCTLTIDNANKTISYAEGSPMLCIADNGDDFYDIEVFEKLYLKVQDSFSGIPQNPSRLEYSDDYYYSLGFYSFVFRVPNVSTEGDVLLSQDLYYKIYLDGDAYEFTEEYDDDLGVVKYVGIGKSEEVPFDLNNDNDFYHWSGTLREVGIYIDGVSTIGVQSIYKYDGTVTESAIVTLDIETGEITEEGGTITGIDSVQSNEIVNRAYYNLNGQKVNNPENGIYVERQTMSDGSIITKKVIRR